MVHFLELIYFLLVVKAILRCLYFWQLKEYRLDRFKEFLTTSQKKQYFLPTKWFLRPKFTLKIFLLAYLSTYFTFLILRFSYQFIGPIIAYLTIPLSVSISVLFLSPISNLIIDLIIFLAKIKIRLMPKSLIVIGITGSYGKTSVKEILAHLLTSKYKVCKTKGTDNTAIGVAKTILKSLNQSHQLFVVEMGAYTKGEIKKICNLVKPSIGIITGITNQHLGLFGSLDNIIKAKYELIKSLPANGLAVFNANNSYTKKMASAAKHLKTISYYQPKIIYATNLLGDYQQINIQAAVLVAKILKVPNSDIKLKLKTIPAFKTMMTQKKAIKQSVVIDDTYNANQQGFLAAIKHLDNLKNSHKVLITSGIIELGKSKQQVHQQIARKSFKVFDEIILTKKDIADIFSNLNPKIKITFQPDYKQLTKYLKTNLKPKSAILLESRMPKKFIDSLCQNQS